MKGNLIIISAYSVYPQIKSSEGIVNKNWYEIIRSDDTTECHLLSSTKNITITSKSNAVIFQTKTNAMLQLLYSFRTAKKTDLRGFLYKAANYIFVRVKRNSVYESLHELIWTKIQKRNLQQLLSITSNVVVWGRVLPTFSVLPMLQAYSKIRFPFVVNINDPLDSTSGSVFSLEEKTIIQTREIAECWTFPSYALAASVAQKYDLDLRRCFVIPHAMRDQKKLHEVGISNNKRIKIVYTGTIYKNTFSATLGTDLLRFCSTAAGKLVDFIFIFSQYDNDVVDWVRKNLPHSELHFKLSREKVLEITAQADCMLIIDGINHKNLLKGKLVEAISQGLPIFSITYADSLMEKVTNEYGGFVAYQDVEGAIYSKLMTLVERLKDENWYTQFNEDRKKVIDKISEKSIGEMTEQVAQFALDRFLWKEGKIQLEPQTPNMTNWP